MAVMMLGSSQLSSKAGYPSIKSSASALSYVNCAWYSLTNMRNGLYTTYAAYSTDDTNVWKIGYQFSSVKRVNKLSWYSYASSERNKNFQVEYSIDGNTWYTVVLTGVSGNTTRVNSTTGQASNANGTNTVTFLTVSGRYFRISVLDYWNNGDTHAGVAEMDVYGR